MRISILTLVLMSSSAFARDVGGPMSTPWDSALQISPLITYTQATIFGEGAVPAYRGIGYGAELDYTVGTQNLSMGPYLAYQRSIMDNTANNSVQKESLSGQFISAGLKLYTNFTYLKLGYSNATIEDKASGTVSNSKTYKSNGIEIGAGINYIFSEYTAMSLGLDVNYYKLDPKDNPITNRLDYVSYGLVLNVRFAIPSSSPNQRN